MHTNISLFKTILYCNLFKADAKIVKASIKCLVVWQVDLFCFISWFLPRASENMTNHHLVNRLMEFEIRYKIKKHKAFLTFVGQPKN